MSLDATLIVSGVESTWNVTTPDETIVLTDADTTVLIFDAISFTNSLSLDPDLAQIASLIPSNDDVLQYKAGNWTNRTIAQLLIDLGLVGPWETPAGAQAKVDAAVSALLAGAPGALDTLLELANALGNDPNFATDIATLIGTKVPKSLYDANTILKADVDDNPVSLVLGEQTMLGRVTGDYIAALTPSQIRTLLALVPGTDVEVHDVDLTTIAGLTPTNDDVLQRKAGAWVNRTLAQLATDMGVSGGSYQPLDSDLTAIAALSTTSYGRAFLALADAAAGRTALGLGTAATQATGAFDAAGAAAAAQAASQPLDSDLTAIAALSTTSFGRGVLALADAAALRTLSGSVIGTDVEAHDADLTTIAGLSPTDDDIIQRKAGAWTNRTMAQLASDLSISGYQPLDSDLTAIAALATTSFGRGLLTLADAAAGRTAFGLGTAAVAASGDFDAAGAAAAAQAASQPVDSDLTAIAALSTTSFGRGFLVLADAAAGRTALGLGTAALSASGDFQPVDSDLTAIAALATTAFGRSVLALADAAALRTLAGTVIGTDVQAFDADLSTIAGLTATTDNVIQSVGSAWASRTPAQFKTAAGLVVGTDIEAHDSDLTTIAGLSPTNDDVLQRKSGAWANRTIAQLLTDLGIASNYQPLDSDLTAIAALTTTSFGRSVLALADAAALRTLAGLVIGTDVQAYDADLAAIAGLTATTDNFIVSVASAWASRTPAQVRTTLALVIGTNVQAWDADLDTIAGLTATTDNFMVANSSAWASRTPAQARTHMGLGTAAVAATGSSTGQLPLAENVILKTLTSATGDLIYASSANTPARLAVGTAGQVLGIAAGGTTPSWVTQDGWIADSHTWVYASATTFTIAGVDLTATFTKGTRISYNDGGVDYGVVASVAFSTNTTVTLIANTDYSIANATLTAPRYSYVANPQGYPTWFTYLPTFVGWTTPPSGAIYRYFAIGSMVHVHVDQVIASGGTSTTTGVQIAGPIACANSGYTAVVMGTVINNGASSTTQAARAYIAAPAATITCDFNMAGGLWTASGVKQVLFDIEYQF